MGEYHLLSIRPRGGQSGTLHKGNRSIWDFIVCFGSGQVVWKGVSSYIHLVGRNKSDSELQPTFWQHSKCCVDSTQLMGWDQNKEGSSNGFVGKAWRMSKKKVLLTIIDPPGEFFTGSKESLARWWESERGWGNLTLAPKFSFCLLNCQRWFTVHMYTYFIEGSWSPAPHQLSHLEYSSKAPKTTEAILSGVIWTENHLFWKLSELKLVNSICFFPRTLPSGAHVLQRGVDQGERGKAKKAGQGDFNCWW